MTADQAFTLLYTVEATLALGLLGGLFSALFYGFTFMKPSKEHG